MSIIVSAPGKLVLLGEHAVVHGQPCLVTSVSQRLYLHAVPIESPELIVEAPQLHVSVYRKPLAELGEGAVPKAMAFIEHAVRRVCFERPHIGVHIRTHSEFSAQYGFGSSSAAAVCAVAAMQQLYGNPLDLNRVFETAYGTVRDVQKTGSGVDIAAATYGGTLVYEAGGRRLEPIAFPLAELIVGYSGVKADTVTILNEVADRARRYPDVLSSIYALMGQLVRRYVDDAATLSIAEVGELMNLNQGLLEALDVSSTRLSAMVHAARAAGAYGAKLSGAGRGDCMLALAANRSRADVEEAITTAGGEVPAVRLGVEGVRTEASHPAFV